MLMAPLFVGFSLNTVYNRLEAYNGRESLAGEEEALEAHPSEGTREVTHGTDPAAPPR
jgi:hypothetical protein